MAAPPIRDTLARTIIPGAQVPSIAYPEAASQSFNAGDFVTLASGAITLATATAGATSTSLAGIVLGMALAPATGTTGNLIPVALAAPGVQFSLPVCSGTASSTSVSTSVGSAYDLAKPTLGGVATFAVNLASAVNASAAATTSCVSVIDYDRSSLGQANGRLWVSLSPVSRLASLR